MKFLKNILKKCWFTEKIFHVKLNICCPVSQCVEPVVAFAMHPWFAEIYTENKTWKKKDKENEIKKPSMEQFFGKNIQIVSIFMWNWKYVVLSVSAWNQLSLMQCLLDFPEFWRFVYLYFEEDLNFHPRTTPPPTPTLRSFRTKIHKEWKWQMSGE